MAENSSSVSPGKPTIRSVVTAGRGKKRFSSSTLSRYRRVSYFRFIRRRVVIPYARGPVRSLPLEAAVEETRRLRAEGYQEIVLTGIEISSWGRGEPDRAFYPPEFRVCGSMGRYAWQ